MIFIIWLALCFVIAYGASQRGRSAVGWFFISALLSPIIGIIILVCLPKIVPEPVKHKNFVADEDDEQLEAFIKWREEKKAKEAKS